MQGRMTLLLGPPGAGKTTLLKALAGKLSHSNLHVSHYLIAVSLIELALTPNFALLTAAR
jgi:ABC-type hemin transport system ATPase subunit